MKLCNSNIHDEHYIAFSEALSSMTCFLFLIQISVTETLTDSLLSTEADVNIQVTDVNDNNPVFEFDSYTFEVDEEQDPVTVVLTPVSPSSLSSAQVQVYFLV